MKSIIFAIFLLASCSSSVSLWQPLNTNLSAGVGSPVVVWRWKEWGSIPARSLSGSLIFQGLESNMVKIAYRELTGTIAQGPNEPTISQDLTFDISSSKVINFRGCSIEVVNVTPTFINYRVLSAPPVDLVSSQY